MQNFIQNGQTMTYTNGDSATIESGGVVLVGNLIGIAKGKIIANATGVLSMEGVFELPKASAAVIAQGALVQWDKSAGKFVENSAADGKGDVTGACVAWEAAKSGDAVVRVKINTAAGVVA